MWCQKKHCVHANRTLPCSKHMRDLQLSRRCRKGKVLGFPEVLRSFPESLNRLTLPHVQLCLNLSYLAAQLRISFLFVVLLGKKPHARLQCRYHFLSTMVKRHFLRVSWNRLALFLPLEVTTNRGGWQCVPDMLMGLVVLGRLM